MGSGLITTGLAARRLGVKDWQVRRLYERGLLPEPETRLGGYRAIPSVDLPLIEAKLREEGYLPKDGAGVEA